MGILDTLFGRQKPTPVGPERLFAISTADTTLQTAQDLKSTGVGAMCFRGVASGPFAQMQRDLDAMLTVAEKDQGGAQYRYFQDDLGYTWLIFESGDFQTLVTTVHVASRTLLDQGYGSQLLFAIFPFKDSNGHVLYWIYNYKRGTFYPFVPQADSHDKLRRRNNPEELRLASALKDEMPIEDQIEMWYPVWDLPL
ncbi:MAG TPA: hypothetical protein VFU88_13845 [Ktedonobacterales bacterium]|nr:hypothetical protein [Ktedonobacterales bacterium]